MQDSRNKISARLLVILTLIMTLVMSMTAFADYSSAKDAVAAYKNTGTLSSYVFTTKPAGSSIDSWNDTSTGITYYWDTANESAIISAANSLSAKSTATSNDQQKIEEFSNITNGFGLQADVSGAGALLSGFTGVITTLLGILTVVITIGMTIFTGFDLCYIAFPTFRNTCEEAKQSGSGFMASNKKTSSGETKLKFISDEAQYAVNAAQTTESGKNPFIIYFSKRIVAYMVLAVLLFIFLTGRITIFTDLALKLVSGVLNIIQGV
jgi:hypothetical protein